MTPGPLTGGPIPMATSPTSAPTLTMPPLHILRNDLSLAPATSSSSSSSSSAMVDQAFDSIAQQVGQARSRHAAVHALQQHSIVRKNLNQNFENRQEAHQHQYQHQHQHHHHHQHHPHLPSVSPTSPLSSPSSLSMSMSRPHSMASSAPTSTMAINNNSSTHLANSVSPTSPASSSSSLAAFALTSTSASISASSPRKRNQSVPNVQLNAASYSSSSARSNNTPVDIPSSPSTPSSVAATATAAAAPSSPTAPALFSLSSPSSPTSSLTKPIISTTPRPRKSSAPSSPRHHSLYHVQAKSPISPSSPTSPTSPPLTPKRLSSLPGHFPGFGALPILPALLPIPTFEEALTDLIEIQETEPRQRQQQQQQPVKDKGKDNEQSVGNINMTKVNDTSSSSSFAPSASSLTVTTQKSLKSPTSPSVLSYVTAHSFQSSFSAALEEGYQSPTSPISPRSTMSTLTFASAKTTLELQQQKQQQQQQPDSASSDTRPMVTPLSIVDDHEQHVTGSSRRSLSETSTPIPLPTESTSPSSPTSSLTLSSLHSSRRGSGAGAGAGTGIGARTGVPERALSPRRPPFVPSDEPLPRLPPLIPVPIPSQGHSPVPVLPPAKASVDGVTNVKESVDRGDIRTARQDAAKPPTTPQAPLAADIINEKAWPEAPEKFLERLLETVSKQEIGNVLSKGSDPFHIAVLRRYMDVFDFRRDPIDLALRKFLLDFHFPKEAQQIDRVLEAFAGRYHTCNPHLFRSADIVYTIAFSLMLLHTDAHNKHVRHKMTKDQYVKQARCIDTVSSIPSDVLEVLYDNIVFLKFVYAEDGMEGGLDGHKQPEVSQPPGGSWFTKRRTASTQRIDSYSMIRHGSISHLAPDLSDLIPFRWPYYWKGTVEMVDNVQLNNQFTSAPMAFIPGLWSRRQSQPPMVYASSPAVQAGSSTNILLTVTSEKQNQGLGLQQQPTRTERSVPGSPGSLYASSYSSVPPAMAAGHFAASSTVTLGEHSPVNGAAGGSTDNASSLDTEFVELKMAKLGVLSRKIDIENGRKSAVRGWKDLGVILSGSQLLFFTETAWFHHQNRAQPGFNPNHPPEADGFFAPQLGEGPPPPMPQALISTFDSIAVVDSGYQKYPHVFRLVCPNGKQYLLRASSEYDMNDWMAKINYASAFKTAGVRMRNYRVAWAEDVIWIKDDQGRHQLRRRRGTTGIEGTAPAAFGPDGRAELIKNKIKEIDRQIQVCSQSLATDLRQARNLEVMIPLQTSTRQRIIQSATVVGKRLRQLMLERTKLDCYRTIMERDLSVVIAPALLMHQKGVSREVTLAGSTIVSSVSDVSSGTTMVNPDMVRQHVDWAEDGAIAYHISSSIDAHVHRTREEYILDPSRTSTGSNRSGNGTKSRKFAGMPDFTRTVSASVIDDRMASYPRPQQPMRRQGSTDNEGDSPAGSFSSGIAYASPRSSSGLSKEIRRESSASTQLMPPSRPGMGQRAGSMNGFGSLGSRTAPSSPLATQEAQMHGSSDPSEAGTANAPKDIRKLFSTRTRAMSMPGQRPELGSKTASIYSSNSQTANRLKQIFEQGMGHLRWAGHSTPAMNKLDANAKAKQYAERHSFSSSTSNGTSVDSSDVEDRASSNIPGRRSGSHIVAHGKSKAGGTKAHTVSGSTATSKHHHHPHHSRPRIQVLSSQDLNGHQDEEILETASFGAGESIESEASTPAATKRISVNKKKRSSVVINRRVSQRIKSVPAVATVSSSWSVQSLESLTPSAASSSSLISASSLASSPRALPSAVSSLPPISRDPSQDDLQLLTNNSSHKTLDGDEKMTGPLELVVVELHEGNYHVHDYRPTLTETEVVEYHVEDFNDGDGDGDSDCDPHQFSGQSEKRLAKTVVSGAAAAHDVDTDQDLELAEKADEDHELIFKSELDMLPHDSSLSLSSSVATSTLTAAVMANKMMNGPSRILIGHATNAMSVARTTTATAAKDYFGVTSLHSAKESKARNSFGSSRRGSNSSSDSHFLGRPASPPHTPATLLDTDDGWHKIP